MKKTLVPERPSTKRKLFDENASTREELHAPLLLSCQFSTNDRPLDNSYQDDGFIGCESGVFSVFVVTVLDGDIDHPMPLMLISRGNERQKQHPVTVTKRLFTDENAAKKCCDVLSSHSHILAAGRLKVFLDSTTAVFKGSFFVLKDGTVLSASLLCPDEVSLNVNTIMSAFRIPHAKAEGFKDAALLNASVISPVVPTVSSMGATNRGERGSKLFYADNGDEGGRRCCSFFECCGLRKLVSLFLEK